MTKRIVSALLAAAVAFNISVAAKEMTNANLEIVVPAYEIASKPESTLIISGTTASCKSTVTGKSVKSISAEHLKSSGDCGYGMKLTVDTGLSLLILVFLL